MVVKVAEYQSTTQIVVVRGEGKSELMELEGGAGSTAMTQSAKWVQQLLMKLYVQGCVLKSAFIGDPGSSSTLGIG